MKIARVQAGFSVTGHPAVWGSVHGAASPPVSTFVRITEDESGLVGTSMTWSPGATNYALACAIRDELAPRLGGLDPFDREGIWRTLHRRTRTGLPALAVAAIDVAVWDLVGRISSLSICRLLGGCPRPLRAYASTTALPSLDEYRRLAESLVAHGYTAIKLHPFGEWRQDLEVCRAVRETVGDTVDLMLDSLGVYRRDEAMRVGRAIEDLGFVWFEEPLPDNDLDGYRWLTEQLAIPVTGTDAMRWDLSTLNRVISHRMVDIVRVDAARHGFTLGRKLGAATELACMDCETHAYGPTPAMVANLQLGGALLNCHWAEIIAPSDVFGQSPMPEVPLGPGGTLAIPDGPGLGFPYDEDFLSSQVTWV